MIAAYKAMYEFSIDKSNSQFKAPFNQIWSDSETATPKDTAIVTPNADTPYSLVEMDLRAEPLVFCPPKVEKGRYYTVQLADLYSYNVGYMSSRTTDLVEANLAFALDGGRLVALLTQGQELTGPGYSNYNP